ncbi:MAG: UbiA family prenyltransferase [Planctomycetes bacterium]|nr:UbiA family prenyltransferase [Planctomycetota bacterium]
MATFLAQLVAFARTIRLSHSLFALPFALGTALVAEPPIPAAGALALLVACMVAARTAAMGMNRVADAALDARNPRTRDRAIPAGRLSRRAALGLTLASGAAFVVLAWGFWLLRGNAWPGLLAVPFLAVLFGYSWTKRVTVLTHWVLGLALGLAPVGAWMALRGEAGGVAVLVGAAVLFWTAGFDILYAFQDAEVDRREGLHSVPARLGPRAARWVAIACHAVMVVLLALAILYDNQPGIPGEGARRAVLGEGSEVALEVIALALVIQHVRLRRATADRIAAAFLPMNAGVSLIWLGGVIYDVVAWRGAAG